MYTECGYLVQVTVTVPLKLDHDNFTKEVKKTQIHPVLDNKNRPVDAPSAFQINTSIMRCLVKAISLHGLGLYIYAGEDLPPDADKFSAEQKSAFDTLLAGDDPMAFWLFQQGMSDETKIALHNSFEKGQITKQKKLAGDMEGKGSVMFSELNQALIDHIESGDTGGIHEVVEELGDKGKVLAFRGLSAELQARATELMS